MRPLLTSRPRFGILPAMVTGELRNKVDQIWQTIWTGGITSPITVLEQITSVRPDGTRRNGP